MQRPIVTIPYRLMRLTGVDWWIDWGGQGSQDRVGGGSQVIVNAFSRWVANLDLTFGRGDVGEWRAHILAGQGRVGMFRLFMIDPAVFNEQGMFPLDWDMLGMQLTTGVTNGYEAGPTIPAAANAAIGSETIRVSVSDPAVLPRAGQILSSDDWPMAVTSVTEEGGGTFELGVQMPLRAPIAFGDPISLIGTGLFEMTGGMAGRAGYGPRLRSQPTFSVREVLNR